MKWICPTRWHQKAEELVSPQEFRAFIISFLAVICIFIQTIAKGFYCGDGNLCGILYRPHGDYGVEDIAGRFLIKYVAHIRSLFVLGPFMVLICLLCLIIGSFLICRMLRIESTLGKVVSVITVTMYPAFADTFAFRFTADSYVIAFLLAVLAVYIFGERQSILRGIVTFVLLLAVLNLYQAYFFVAVALFVVVFLKQLLANDEKKQSEPSYRLLIRVLIAGGMAICVLLCYFVIVKIFSPSTSRLEYETSVSILSLLRGTGEAYIGFFRVFAGEGLINNAWKHRGLVNIFLMGLSLVLSIYLLFKRKCSPLKWVLYLFCLIFVLPLAMNGISIINYGYLHPMMVPTMALPYTFLMGLWEALCRDKEKEDRTTVDLFTSVTGVALYLSMSYLVVVMVVYIGIYQMVQNYYSAKTENLGQRIVTNLEMMYPEIDSECYVYIYGGPDNDNQPEPYSISMARIVLRGTFATEVFNENTHGYLAWNNILEERMGISYRIYNLPDIETFIHSDEFKKLPIYPQTGSVYKIKEGHYFVKLMD